jgi:hypothetical protein
MDVATLREPRPAYRSAQLIAPGENMDYWDHDGWKDPYSSPYLTDRQSAYVRALTLNILFSPRILLDENTESKGKRQKL